MFQDSFLETMRLRNIREGHRVASLGSRLSVVTEAAPYEPEEHLFDCRNRTSLPGRAVTDPSTGSEAFQTVFKTTVQVAEFYQTILGRNSVDNQGMDLVSSLNYGRNYQNAFWNGQQMVYGNGDQHIFIDFWKSPDVIGHELTHGVTQNESGLRYEGESGALNESLSDCFGAAFNQWVSKAPASKDDGWLIGAGIMGPDAKAKGYICLRDMVNPGAQHCLSPQPISYANFDPTADVHINSGIPNRAFALFARALGGNSYESPIKLWYSASTGRHLSSSATFADFAKSTIDAADRWTGPDKDKLAKAIRDAWHTVEVPLPFVWPMRIKIERRGGLVGRPAVGECEESALTAAERQALKDLPLSPPPSTPSPGADRFHYKITVEDEKGTRELEVPEHAMLEVLAEIPKIGL